MEPARVVVHLKDGRIGKGFANDFNPTRNSFHLYEETGGSQKQLILLEMKDLKAIFFVKTFEGNKTYRERKNFAKDDLVQGRRVEVTFSDGEVIQGSTVGYDPQRLGFFLIPIDSKSNNIRIFVVSSAVKKFRFL